MGGKQPRADALHFGLHEDRAKNDANGKFSCKNNQAFQKAQATVGAENKSLTSNDDSEDEYEDGGEVFDMPLQHAQEERKRHRKTVLKSVGVDINKNIIHDFQRVQITGQVEYWKRS
jgi:hypothetical protein